MDGVNCVSYHFRKIKQKENMVPESRNVVLHSWVFLNDYFSTQCSFTLIIEKESATFYH